MGRGGTPTTAEESPCPGERGQGESKSALLRRGRENGNTSTRCTEYSNNISQGFTLFCTEYSNASFYRRRANNQR
jgi:hypothetical protein